MNGARREVDRIMTYEWVRARVCTICIGRGYAVYAVYAPQRMMRRMIRTMYSYVMDGNQALFSLWVCCFDPANSRL